MDHLNVETYYLCAQCNKENKFNTSEPLICNYCRDSRIFFKKKNPIPILYKTK